MDKNFKKILGITTALSVAGGLIIYSNLEKPLTYEELNAYIEIVDHEAKQAGGIKLQNVNKDNVYKELNKKIREREVIEDNVVLEYLDKKNEFNKSDYKKFREDLLNKVDKLNK